MENKPAIIRDIHTVTAEIRTIKETTKRLLLSSYVEIGRRLVEAKELLPHGEWGAWLETEVDFSQRTANELMRIFKEYGTEQVSLFGDINSQALANLSYTQAVLLLKVPKDEREEFVEENKIETLSTRELEALIKERDAAQKKAAEAENKLSEAVTEQRRLRQENQELRNRPVEVAVQIDEKAVEKARQEEADKWAAKEKTLRKQLEQTQKAQKEIDSQLIEAQRKLAEAEQRGSGEDAAPYKAEVERLKKELAMSDSRVTTFKLHFNEVQALYSKLLNELTEIEAADAETGAKLRAALKALVESFERRA